MGEGGGCGRISRTVPLDLPLELTEEYIIKAVFIYVQGHWVSDTEKTNRSFLFRKAEWITRQKFSEWDHYNNLQITCNIFSFFSGRSCRMTCWAPTKCTMSCNADTCVQWCRASECECHGKNCEQICAGSHYKKVLCKASSCKQRCSGSHCYGLECYGKSCVQKCEGSHCTNTICKAGSCKQECYGSHCHGLECYGKSCEHICSGSHCSKVICKSNTCKQSWTGDGCGLKCQGKNCCKHQAAP